MEWSVKIHILLSQVPSHILVALANIQINENLEKTQNNA